jgi:hypothetical protein
VLTRYRRVRHAAANARPEDLPGWGYLLVQGTETWWESWDPAAARSRDHYMFGTVDT